MKNVNIIEVLYNIFHFSASHQIDKSLAYIGHKMRYVDAQMTTASNSKLETP